MKQGYEAIIVGGGVIGSSMAYSLSKRGLKVALLEQGRIAGQASGAAAGMLAAQAESESPGPMFEALLCSREMFPNLSEELRECCGIDIGFNRRGLFKVATDKNQEAALQVMVKVSLEAGQAAEWLASDDVRRRVPGITPSVTGAAFYPDDAQVSAPDLTMAFAKSAAALGAEVREFAEVLGIVRHNGKAIGVRTREGIFYGDKILIAAGFRSDKLLADAGVELPMFPVKGEIFSVVTHAPLLHSTVFTKGCYLVPKRGGRLIVGATSYPNCDDPKVTLGGISKLMDQACKLLPSIAEAEWERAWSGLRPQTRDGMPYVGECRRIGGLYIAAGHYRNGILLSPWAGELAARWAAEGMDDAPGIFRPERVESNAVRAGEGQ